MMAWKVRYEVRGGHIHCALFVAPLAQRTFAYCGEFVVSSLELADLQNAFPGAEFIEGKKLEPVHAKES